MSPRINALAVIAAMPFVWLLSVGILCFDTIRFVMGTILILPFMTLNFAVNLVRQLGIVLTGRKSDMCSKGILFLKDCTECANKLRTPYRRTHCEIKQPKSSQAKEIKRRAG